MSAIPADIRKVDLMTMAQARRAARDWAGDTGWTFHIFARPGFIGAHRYECGEWETAWFPFEVL